MRITRYAAIIRIDTLTFATSHESFRQRSLELGDFYSRCVSLGQHIDCNFFHPARDSQNMKKFNIQSPSIMRLW